MMRDTRSEQAILDFYTYPPIGGDDWRYAFQTARVRALETQMLTRGTLHDMASAETFEQAAELLSASEYGLPHAGKRFAEVEQVLKERRLAVRELFAGLCIDKPIVELLRTRDDFANLRLALRRTLTERPVGIDYSDGGNVAAAWFAPALEEGNESLFGDHIRRAVDAATLAYYQNKDIRRIDYAIDAVQAEHNLSEARRLESPFLLGLFRIQIDLTNIRTMLRLKFTEAEQRDVFLTGGYIERERLEKGVDSGYEALGSLFFATPYLRIVETGAGYLASDKSFLKLEQQCDDYLMGFVKSTIQITAGPQPIIAYLLAKENEIRTVRLILTAKKNRLDTKLILDRIS